MTCSSYGLIRIIGPVQGSGIRSWWVQRRKYGNEGDPTIYFVQFCNLRSVLPTSNNVIVGLVPARDRCQSRTRKSSKRVKKKAVEYKGPIVGNNRHNYRAPIEEKAGVGFHVGSSVGETEIGCN